MPFKRQSEPKSTPVEEPILLAPPHRQSENNQTNTEGQSFSKESAQEERKEFRGKEREWYDYFDRRFGPIVIMILWFAMPLERATFYAPQPDECHALAPHMARIMPRIEDAINKVLHLPAWAHDVAISSDSLIQIGFITMGYLDRIGLLEKLAPYFTNSVVRMRRNVNEQSTQYPGGLHETNNNGPVDLNAVRGLGEQWRPS